MQTLQTLPSCNLPVASTATEITGDLHTSSAPTSVEAKELVQELLLTYRNSPAKSFDELKFQIDSVYSRLTNWEDRKEVLFSVLENAKVPCEEISKYALFDDDYAYTRNLVVTDGLNYALLILCWNSDRESKIHDHPCDGCFVKVLRGQIEETRYSIITEENELIPQSTISAHVGEVTFMDNFIGLHKIGNPSQEGAVTLHLYTPPYSQSKLWNCLKYSDSQEGRACFYSMYGQRVSLNPDDPLPCIAK